MDAKLLNFYVNDLLLLSQWFMMTWTPFCRQDDQVFSSKGATAQSIQICGVSNTIWRRGHVPDSTQ